MENKMTFDHIEQAIVCRPMENFAEGHLKTVGVPDYARAISQHGKYCEALEKCGVSIIHLNSDTNFSATRFISDWAVVTESLAVIASVPDDDKLHKEQKEIASALAGTRFLKFIMPPGRLDCSDVLQLNDHFYIGLSDNTNQEGAAQLAFFLKEYGYNVTMLDMEGKSIPRLNAAAVYLGNNRILIHGDLARHYAFLGYDKTAVPHNERGAANSLMINGTLIMPSGHHETMNAVKALGIPVIEVNISEFEKMNCGAGCLSLRLPKTGNAGTVQIPAKRKTAA